MAQQESPEPQDAPRAESHDERWRKWAEANYPPAVASAVRAAAMKALQDGGDQRAAYEAAIAVAGQGSHDAGLKRPRDTEVAANLAEPLAYEVTHDQGSIGLNAHDELEVRMQGRNPITRRQWQRASCTPCADVGGVLVASRDRKVFGVDVWDRKGALAERVRGVNNKSALDALLSRLEADGTGFRVLLAHPSHGLKDPYPKEIEGERKRALSFNSDEQRARANSGRQEVKVKTYENSAAYSRDARRMTSDGWLPQGQSSGRGRVSMSGTAGKLVLTGGLGAVTGFSRKGSKVTVTWTRTLPIHAPRAFLPVPEVPASRTFPPDPYFPVRALTPVEPGHEFPEPGKRPELAREIVGDSGEKRVVAPPVPTVIASQRLRAVTSEPTRAAPAEQAAAATVIDRMRQLEELKTAGLVSEEEYAAKRSALIGEL